MGLAMIQSMAKMITFQELVARPLGHSESERRTSVASASRSLICSSTPLVSAVFTSGLCPKLISFLEIINFRMAGSQKTISLWTLSAVVVDALEESEGELDVTSTVMFSLTHKSNRNTATSVVYR